MIDVLGKIVENRIIFSSIVNEYFNIEKEASGIYFIQIRINENIITKKIVKN